MGSSNFTLINTVKCINFGKNIDLYKILNLTFKTLLPMNIKIV